MPDDSLMNRFDRNGLTRFRARDGIIALTLCMLLLVIFEGAALRRAGERMDPGWDRDVVLAVGKPAGWVADQLPFAAAADDVTAALSPDEELDDSGSFATVAAQGDAPVAPVTADAFDPADIGAKPPERKRLRTLLVTGDSMVMPLDALLARRLAPRDVDVTRDAHLGTGISKSFLVDWGQLSSRQVKRGRPDAVVVFIGANEGFPIEGSGGREVECCGADWAALYANRARRMADTYRRGGAARVYWVTIPTPRDPDRQKIQRVVNAAIRVAAQPWRSQVRVIDSAALVSPRGYQDAIEGRIVRASDGIHLSDAGARMLADAVLARLDDDFIY
jgi:hypothetical protein